MFSNNGNMRIGVMKSGEYNVVFSDIIEKRLTGTSKVVMKVFGLEKYYSETKHMNFMLEWKTPNSSRYLMHTDEIYVTKSGVVEFCFTCDTNHEFIHADKSDIKSLCAETDGYGNVIFKPNRI